MHNGGVAGTFWEHVLSLRSHIIWGGIVFIIAACVIFSYAADTLIGYLLLPLNGQTLIFLSPLGPFFFKIKISIYAALGASLPVWLGLMLHFVFPALQARKRIVSTLFVLLSGLLSLGSLLVTYFYFVPMTLKFLLGFVVPGTTFLLTAESYVQFFLLQLIVAFVVFQLPVVIVLLAYLRILSPYILSRQRRLLYPILLILLAIVTPTTDAFTLIIVSVPAVLLVEVGIVIAKAVYGKG